MKDYSKESLEGVFQLEKADYQEEKNSIDKNSSNFMKAVSAACNVLEEKSKVNEFETDQLNEFLSYNDILSREVAIKELPRLRKGINIVVDLGDKNAIALIKFKGKNWVYDPTKETTSTYTDVNELKALYDFKEYKAYEIFAKLPFGTRGPIDALQFTLGSSWFTLIAFILSTVTVVMMGLTAPMITNYLVSDVLPQSSYSLLVTVAILVIIIAIFNFAITAFSQFFKLNLKL